jgi:XapX domain-containing protein
MNPTDVLFATATGLVAGAVFALVDAPIPAPPAFAGVMGIVGVYLGYRIVEYVDLVGTVADALPL